jgi:hypothetical protein
MFWGVSIWRLVRGGLTERSADLGQVAELDGELHAQPVIVGDGRDFALDVAALGIGGLEEGGLGKNRLVDDTDRVVDHFRGIAELLLLTVRIQPKRKVRLVECHVRQFPGRLYLC